MLASLAQQIVKDGEGAKKFVTIENPWRGDGFRCQKKIARSDRQPHRLVKTAIAGSDPQAGAAIPSAAGNAGVAFEVRRTPTSTCRASPYAAAVWPLTSPGRRVGRRSWTRRIHAPFNLALRGRGRGQNPLLDLRPLTEEYIRINASYRTMKLLLLFCAAAYIVGGTAACGPHAARRPELPTRCRGRSVQQRQPRLSGSFRSQNAGLWKCSTTKLRGLVARDSSRLHHRNRHRQAARRQPAADDGTGLDFGCVDSSGPCAAQGRQGHHRAPG